MELLPQALADGILLGGIYITIAIAFSLTYGVMHVIDFAVGEWIMFGAFTGYYLNKWTGLDPFLFLPVIFAAYFVVGYLVQPVIHRVLSGTKGNPFLMGLVFTFGLAIMFKGLALTVFGYYSNSIPSMFSEGAFTFDFESMGASVTIPTVRLVGLIYALAITFALHYLLKKTNFGLGVRALAQHKDAAGLMGVNSKRTGSYVYGIYVGVSAMTGVLLGCILSIGAQMGNEYTIFAFFVVVLAGMGYLAGVPWAALLLGMVQSIFMIYFNPSHTLLAVFVILYLILLISPRGLFAKGV